MTATGEPIAVTVLGGYLGAGKTTLVNHILRVARERIVVLVNDFGSINIDEELIASVDEDTITLANGCICCSLIDGLAGALEQVRALDPRPARLVIEASGVADPASIAAYAHDRGLRLDGAVTVVDAETVRAKAKDKYVGDTITRQISSADLLVVNKVDLLTEERLADLKVWLREVSRGTPMVEADHGRVDLEVLLGTDRSATTAEGVSVANAVESGGGSVAEDVFVTFSFTEAARFSKPKLQALLVDWPAAVVRAKGIVRVHSDVEATASDTVTPETLDRRCVVQRVGSRVALSDDGPWIEPEQNRLVAIAVRAELSDSTVSSLLTQLRAAAS